MLLLAPKISIVMAVYNKAVFLPESVESVLNQAFDNLELICVDAGSTDGSFEILQEYALKDERIKVYRLPFTSVPAITKNFGIDLSKGDYVFNLDADDYLSPDALEKMYAVACTINAQAVIPDLQTISIDGQLMKPLIVGLNGKREILLTNRQAVVESLDWTIHGFALWDGNLIRKIRLEEFGTYSDEFSARNLFYQCDIVTFSEGLYYHRINNQSITGKISIQTYDRPYALYRTASFLEEHGFDENYINGLHFAVFKDCCFLLYLLKNLTYPQSSDAELRIKKVHELVSKNRVRDSVFYKEYGRAALWRVEGKIGKYIIVLLTFLNWELLKKAPLQLLF